MTITLYLRKQNLLSDLQVLRAIFDAGKPEFVEPLIGFLNPLKILTDYVDNRAWVEIQVTPEEFALIVFYTKGDFLNN